MTFFLFKIRLRQRLARLRHLVKRVFCRHHDTYISSDWKNCYERCKRCHKVLEQLPLKD